MHKARLTIDLFLLLISFMHTELSGQKVIVTKTNKIRGLIMTHRLYLYCMLALSSIATCSTFITMQAAEEVESCVLCLEPLCNGQELSILPCFHKFHKTCIQSSFEFSLLCPICRTNSRGEFGDLPACSPRPTPEQEQKREHSIKIAGDPSADRPDPELQRVLELSQLEDAERQRINAQRKQKEDADMQAAIAASQPLHAQPVPYPTVLPTDLPIAYAIQHPARAATPSSSSSSSSQATPHYQPYPPNIPGAQPTLGQSPAPQVYPTPPIGAASQAAKQKLPQRPAASASEVAPRSYAQQVLHAAWVKTQSWGTHMSERLQAGWRWIKASLGL